jgi:hypothetical protein
MTRAERSGAKGPREWSEPGGPGEAAREISPARADVLPEKR